MSIVALALTFAPTLATVAQECGSVTRIDHEFASAVIARPLEIVGASADGSVIVAGGLTDIFSGIHNQAFTWSEAAGQRLLNYSGYEVYPTCISADGSVIAGHGRIGFFGSPPENQAFIWGVNSGWVDPSNYIESEVADMSADGLVLVGWNRPRVAPFEPRPYRWTPATGMVDLGIIPGARRGYADAVSGDGLVVVGRSIDHTNTTFTLLWGPGGTVVIGSRAVRAAALSFDGSIVVGTNTSATGAGNRAFRWTSATGLVELPLPPGYIATGASDISDDGSVILGYAAAAQGGTRMFRWSSTAGYHFITDAIRASFGRLGLSGDGATVFKGDRLWRKDRAATFCAQAAVGACTPSVQFVGVPSLSASTAFQVMLQDAPTNSFGLMFYGSAGPARIPGLYGDLCVGAPYVRVGVAASGGNPQQGPCDGTFVIDFNAYLQSAIPHGLVVGDSVIAQFWYRDNATVLGAAWSNAVAIPICP